MANIVITTTTNLIKVDFGEYSSQIGFSKGTWRKDKFFHLEYFSTHIVVWIQGETEWLVSYDGSSNTYQIDTIDGVAPTSNSDLYNKLQTIIE